jgi:HAMP domain-containing protein
LIVTTPNLVAEIAFAANPLDTVDAYVTLNGTATSYLATPDAAALDITGDIDIAVRCSLNDWTPATAQSLVSKNLIGAVSYYLLVNTSGQLELRTSADGSTTLVGTSTALGLTDTVSYWVRATLDVNNGAGGRVYSFYTAPDSRDEPAEWTLVSTQTTAGTTSIFVSTMEVEVGAQGFGNSVASGRFRRAIIRNGIDGTVVADFDAYDMHNTTATTFGSSRIAGQTWTRLANATPTITPTWTDVTAYVRNQSVQIQRGKQNELQTFGTSSCSFTLMNRDRRFDPDYSSSPYAPNVLPGKRVRIRAEWLGTRYDLWSGFIDDWPQQFASGNVDASVPIMAYDIMAMAGEVELRDAALAYLDTVSDVKLAMRQMADGEWWDRITTGYYRRRAGLTDEDTTYPVTGQTTGVLFNGSTFYTAGSVDTNFGLPVSYGTSSTDALYISCWFKTTASGPSATNWMLLMGSGYTSAGISVVLNRIGIDSSGLLRVVLADFNPGSFPSVQSQRPVNDGAWHHMVVTNNASACKLYIDGADVTANEAPNYGGAIRVQVIGGKISTNPSDTNFTGSLGDIIIGCGTTILSPEQVRTWYDLARGYEYETSNTRATRVISQLTSNVSQYTLTPRPKAAVAAIDTEGQSLLAHLQVVADSEQGRLFADRYGRIRLDDRYWWQSTVNGRVSQATLSDDGSDVPYSDVMTYRAKREVQNDITVTGSTAVKYRSVDTASVTAYGRRTASITTLLAANTDVQSMADGLVTLRKTPLARTGAITVRPMTSTSQWPTVLELEIADRVTFELMPARNVTATSQYTRTLIIERIDWRINVGDWSCIITGSPVPTQTLFRWGTSLLGGADVLGY